jgi:serine/threonine-protein kinase
VATTVAMLRERETAARATAMSGFLEGILLTADADEGQADVLHVDVLRQASDRASEQFAGYPELEADIRYLLGSCFHRLSLFDEAAVHMRRALEIRRGDLGLDDPLVRKTAHAYIQILVELLRFDEALPLANEVLAHAPAALGGDPLVLNLRHLKTRMMDQRGHHDAAEEELRDLVADARAALGPDHHTTMLVTARLARVLKSRVIRGERPIDHPTFAEAEALNRDVLERRRRIDGEDARATLYVMIDRADMLRARGALDEAAAIAAEAFQRTVGRYGPDHDASSQARAILGDVRHQQGRYDEAADLLIDNVESHTRRLGEGGMSALAAMAEAIPTIAASDRAAAGERYARTLYDRFRVMGSKAASYTVGFRLVLAHFLSRLGRLDEAETHFAAVQESGEAALTDEQRRELNVYLGAHAAARGRYAEARTRLAAATEDPAVDATRWLAHVARRELAALGERRGEPEP